MDTARRGGAMRLLAALLAAVVMFVAAPGAHAAGVVAPDEEAMVAAAEAPATLAGVEGLEAADRRSGDQDGLEGGEDPSAELQGAGEAPEAGEEKNREADEAASEEPALDDALESVEASGRDASGGAPADEPAAANGMGGAPGGEVPPPDMEVPEPEDGSEFIYCEFHANGRGPMVEELADKMETGPFMNVLTADEWFKGDNSTVATGNVMRIMDPEGNVVSTRTIVVRGDVRGTGRLGMSQVTSLVRAYRGQVPLEGAYLAAADVDGNGSVGMSDVVHAMRLIRMTLDA